MSDQVQVNRYRFESPARTVRSRADADRELPKFVRRLGFWDVADLDGTDFLDDLRKFVIHVHLPIDWYEKHIAKERMWRNGYIAASLLLLLALPVAVHVLNSAGAASVAVVSGLFAFYRGISAWLDERKIVGQRARASASLKEILYGFEQRWDQVELDSNRIVERFRADIDLQIQRGRAIVSEETVAYYDSLSYPVFNLGSMFQTSSTQAKALVGALGQGAASARQTVHATRADFDEVLPSQVQTRPPAPSGL